MDITISDSEDCPVVSGAVTLLWRSYGDLCNSNAVSLPLLVEANDKKLRERYLSYIYDLGATKLGKDGRNLISYLRIRPNFSVWWMTLISEKANIAKSPQITDVIKLMAFSDWASTHPVHTLKLFSANKQLANCLKVWSKKNGVAFAHIRTKSINLEETLSQAILKRLPRILQAILWLARHVTKRWALRGVGISEWKVTDGKITFVSYLLNIPETAVRQGNYENNYWGRLPNALKESGDKTTWLHIYTPHKLLPNAAKAANLLRVFNANSDKKQSHATLDSFISLKVLFRSLLDWTNIACRSFYFERKIRYIDSDGLNLWPLFKNDWNDSLVGKTAMSNALHLNLLNSAFHLLPRQRIGIYLQENMDWEFALIWAWRSFDHGTLVGVPHSCLRYWDLRYFCDQRTFLNRENSMPTPDKVGVNSITAMNLLIESGYPPDKLIPVEALRYGHLSRIKKGSKKNRDSKLKLLVFGESWPEDTSRQLKLLEAALKHTKRDVVVTVKPHPICPISRRDYPSYSIQEGSRSLYELLLDCDLAYTGATSSAALDVFFAKIPLVSYLDPARLNLHPLRGEQNVHIVRTPKELALAIDSMSLIDYSHVEPDKYFFLDNNYKRWIALMNLAPM